MIINLITPLPEIVELCRFGILGKAIEQEKVKINMINIRDFSARKDRRIDDTTYGGGAGMVITPEPVYQAIQTCQPSHIIQLDPKGTQLTQNKVQQLASFTNITLLCGRYEGIDHRIDSYIDEYISIGDYVLSGGDIPALALIDAITRLLPGAMSNPDSHLNDSFSSDLLDHNHYTRPQAWRNQMVPEVLLQGNHKEIDAYRRMSAIGNTWLNRPDLLIGKKFSQNELALFMKFVQNHNE
ncbi:tRNA (guanosine(37)-N1)-methyltransferase TrmD [Candidatus Comchoanobacter bicostacola]|uniref:tRNA (guanine-N(1)-)-methyltransferase n=1 Tax=Candidatus Comchoanobacter bicostacola TaxID=2919598 RepID=A0ABY5DHW3_9GAMM|nr:tRNA (guanosine(37)-N1)-methyltransferase TrmD [Candidatus Comchoanobacter bicostacola]UTC24255.1 tRNA (guanosine(37)-N1)-methyltransferase TrmD [Candidatus Comchoanobacter bicostacola]